MAGDPLGRVYNKQEGSGAAQIFGRSEVVDDLRRTGLQIYAQEEEARKKQAAMVKPKDQKLPEMGQGWYKDNSYIAEGFKQLTLGGTEMIANGVDIATNPNFQNGAYTLRTAIEGSQQQMKMYDVQRNAIVSDPKKYDVDASVVALEEWSNIPLLQRLATPMPEPVYRKEEEKPFDFFAPFDAVKIGIIDNTVWNDDRKSGKQTESPNKKGLMAQIDAVVKANPKIYEEGLKPQENTGLPLWNSEKEMKQFYFDWKIGQGNYTIKEILRNEAEGNVFGSGSGEEEVLFDTDEWRKAFLSGEENAAGYLTGPAGKGVKTNNGYILDGVSKVGTFDLNDPKQLDKASKYIIQGISQGQFSDITGGGVDAVTFVGKYMNATPEEKKAILKSVFKQDDDVVSVYRYTGVGPDLTVSYDGGKAKAPVSREILIIPQMLTDEQLEAYYLSALKGKEKLYNKEFAVTKTGKVVNTGATQPKKTEDPYAQFEDK